MRLMILENSEKVNIFVESGIDYSKLLIDSTYNNTNEYRIYYSQKLRKKSIDKSP
jgi:hypothetical protein